MRLRTSLLCLYGIVCGVGASVLAACKSDDDGQCAESSDVAMFQTWQHRAAFGQHAVTPGSGFCCWHGSDSGDMCGSCNSQADSASWCGESQQNCRGSCGGTWCDASAPTPSPASGFCCHYGPDSSDICGSCNNAADAASWCGSSQRNCGVGCGATWCEATTTTTSTPTSEPPLDIRQCVAKFMAFDFQLYNFAKYGDYFKDDSIFILPEAGEYKGADGIEEYVKFASPYSPYTDSQAPSIEQVVPVAADDSTKTCIFYRFSVAFYNSTAATTAGSYSYSFTSMLKFNFSARDNYLHALYLDLPAAFLEWFFGTLLDAEKTHQYVCGVMKSNCSKTWTSNNLTDMDDCTDKLEALPVFTDGKWFDGKGRGCRALHASFAAINPTHCAHISFEPEEDPMGNTKCQTSARMESTDFFPPEAFTQYERFRNQSGMPPSGFTYELIQ